MLTIATSYQVVTHEAAEHGDIAEHGFRIGHQNFPLEQCDVDPYERVSGRDALATVLDNGVDHIEVHGHSARFYGYPREDYRTGDSVTYCIHVRGDARLIRALVKAVRS